MNSVNITGRLTRDPELRDAGGHKVCEIGVAVNGSKKVGDEWVDKANFIEVVLWGRRAEIVAEYLSKGSRVAVNGELDYQSWEKDGQKRNTIKLGNANVVFLDPKPNGSKPTSDSTSGASEEEIPF
jgi:single-strand DNA-binding protein